MKHMNISLPLKMDMKEVYSRLIDEFDAFPEIQVQEFKNEEFGMCWGEFPDKRRILFYDNSIASIENIVEEIRNPKAEIFGIAEDDIPYHSASNDIITFLCRITLKVADMLKIPCPQLVFQDDINCPGGLAFFCKDNNVVMLNTENVDEEYALNVLRKLFHELRHAFQYKYWARYGKHDYSPVDNPYEYFHSKEEIDAEAFSFSLFEMLFGEGIIPFWEDPNYANGYEDVVEKILTNMDKITPKIDLKAVTEIIEAIKCFMVE